ncbi:MAG TPA: alpha/beta fold hydrolase [Sandaracinaceae bacterium]
MSLAFDRYRAEGPPLVLVHGAGGNARVWAPFARELSGFDVLAPSLPGRAGSAGPACARAADAARALEALLEELGVRGAIVLGHSYGGAVAIELALLSDRVASLALVASGARLRVRASVLAAAEEAVRTGVPMSLELAFAAGTPREAIEAYERAAARTPPDAALADWRACDSFDRMGELGAIERPALVVGGALDALTPPKYQRYLAAHLPRAQLELVEGAGHMLPWERPRELARTLRAWASGAVG